MCPFFNGGMDIDESSGILYKLRYCRGNKDACARYVVHKSMGEENVPSDLYPNMIERAKDIILKG
jgi:hypothetical protein